VEKWRCLTCGYTYDPAVGVPDESIVPGISFEQLPVDWVCPVCGAFKNVFEKE
jgi:rubredoxin